MQIERNLDRLLGPYPAAQFFREVLPRPRMTSGLLYEALVEEDCQLCCFLIVR